MVAKLLASEGSEEEQDAMLAALRASVPDPNVSDLIYYPPDGLQLTPDEIVERALSYRPIQGH